MSTDAAEERLWRELFRRLDNIEGKLDDKVTYAIFESFKHDTTAQIGEIEQELRSIAIAAVSPDQVTTMIGDKLREANARGITNRERWMRYLVAVASVTTTAILIYDRFG